MWTPCFNRQFAKVQNAFPLIAVLYIVTPEIELFCTVDRFVSPSPLRILLDSGDTGRPLTQDCLTLLVDLTTGHYNRRAHSASLWLTFPTSVQQSRTLEHTI